MFIGMISTSLRFFDTNPSGRILNLFTKDLGTIDEHLPRSLLDAMQSCLVMSGAVLLIVTVKPHFVIPIALIGIVFAYVRKIYLNSSRDLKRMEGICKREAKKFLSSSRFTNAAFIPFIRRSISRFYTCCRNDARTTNDTSDERPECTDAGIRQSSRPALVVLVHVHSVKFRFRSQLRRVMLLGCVVRHISVERKL